MSQKDINNMIDTLFDEFVKADGNIDKMDSSKIITETTNIKNLKKVNFSETVETIKMENSNNNQSIGEEIDDIDDDKADELENVAKKTYFDDKSLSIDFSDSITGDLLNNFLLYFKKKNKKPNKFTLLDGVDCNDPYSTNMPLEEMYFELALFVEKEKTNPDFCKVVQFENLNKSDVDNDELYCIMENGIPTFASQSFFALLIELTNIKRTSQSKTKINYDIVSLK